MKTKVLVIIALLFLLAGCDSMMERGPKSGGKEAAEQFLVDYLETVKTATPESVAEDSSIFPAFWEYSLPSFKYLDYKILESEVKIEPPSSEFGREEEAAYVTVLLSYPDLPAALKDFNQEGDPALSDPEKSNKAKGKLLKLKVPAYLEKKLAEDPQPRVEKKVTVRLEFVPYLETWMITDGPDHADMRFIDHLSLKDYKVAGMDYTLGELSLTALRGDEKRLIIQEITEKIKAKKATVDDFNELLQLHGSLGDPDWPAYEEVARQLIEHHPENPRGYYILIKHLIHQGGDSKEIIKWMNKGLEVYEIVDVNKYPDNTSYSIEEEVGNIYEEMVELYLRTDQKEKAKEVFKKHKWKIAAQMPFADFHNLVRRVE